MSFFFLALGIGNHDDGAKAERVGDQRQPDAGIARGALDDGAARAQGAALNGVANDKQRRAVLHRLSRIHELGLAENGAAGGLRCPLQLDERRVAYRLDHVIVDFHVQGIFAGLLSNPARP